MPDSIERLLSNFDPNGSVYSVESLDVGGVDGRDVYNATGDIPFRGGVRRGARDETRDIETDSRVTFLRPVYGNSWAPDEFLPMFEGSQDPFHVRIGGEDVVGMVRIYTKVSENGGLEIDHIRMHFYRGPDLGNLREFAVGPKDMKGIRPVGVHDVGIFVTTRRDDGDIAYRFIEKLDDLDRVDLADSAQLYTFEPGTWGNINRLTLLDGHLAYLGHIAYEHGEGEPEWAKPYFPTAGTVDWRTGEASPMRILATSDFLPPGTPAKRPELKPVLYGTDISYQGPVAKLECGGSDTGQFTLTIPNPVPGYRSVMG